MPETQIAATPGLFGRLRLTVDAWVRQLLAPIEVPFSAGGTAASVRAPFPQRLAMSALAAHPWVRACVRARCDDVGGLPLVAVGAGRAAVPIEDHPFLALMQNPSPGVTQTVFIRQLEFDFSLAGNCYIWLRQTPDGFELHRLHPEHVEADVVRTRQVGWKYGAQRLSISEVWHIRDISWTDTLSQLYGESAIRTLKPGLDAVRAAREQATTQARRGRPDVVMTFPKDSGLGPQAATEIRGAYKASVAANEPAFVVGGGVTVTTTSFAPKDVEFPGLSKEVRDETLAVLRVPPTRAGVPQANYAVAKAELRDYWSGLVSSDLKLFSDAFTAIAHVVGGSLGDSIHFDTSAVEALQTSYDQRQARAGFWVTVMGAEPAAAAAFEGFRGAPVGKLPGGQASSRPAVAVDDQPNRQAFRVERALALWLLTAAERLQGGGADREAETYRLAGVLELATTPGEAFELATEVAAIACETADSTDRDLTELYVFSSEYARSVTRRPRLELAAK